MPSSSGAWVKACRRPGVAHGRDRHAWRPRAPHPAGVIARERHRPGTLTRPAGVDPEPAPIRSKARRERLLPDRAVVEVVVVEVLCLEDALQRGLPGGDALQLAEVLEPLHAGGEDD